MANPQRISLRIKGSLLLLALNWISYLRSFEVVDKVYVCPPSSNRWGFVVDGESIRVLLNEAFELGIESEYDLSVYMVTGLSPCWSTLHQLLKANREALADVELEVGGYFRETIEEEEQVRDLVKEECFRRFLVKLADGCLKPEDFMARAE